MRKNRAHARTQSSDRQQWRKVAHEAGRKNDSSPSPLIHPPQTCFGGRPAVNRRPASPATPTVGRLSGAEMRTVPDTNQCIHPLQLCQQRPP